jgi:hypothetical protein
MRYHALATDYDGTLARNGQVAPHVLQALNRLKASGRKLILVTGRELGELKVVFPALALFDRVVAENGALLYRPATREEKPLAPPPPPTFIEALRKKGVSPLSVGKVIVATWEPHQHAVLETIRELGLEWQVIFNKGAVMVLPSGINKAHGLASALEELGLSPHNVVAIGDAENDNTLLQVAECAVAVANALPHLKEVADWVTKADYGEGVVELIEQLLSDDLSRLIGQPLRHQLTFGQQADGSAVNIAPYGMNLLLAGPSGCGKSTFTTAFLEGLLKAQYQFCLLDPEGDYQDLEGTLPLGDAHSPPLIEEVMKVLEKPGQSGVVCTLAIPFAERASFWQQLLAALRELRSRTGRPHWLVLDEAHHLMPAGDQSSLLNQAARLEGLMLITTQPDLIQAAALGLMDLAIGVGQKPGLTLGNFARAIAQPMPLVPAASLGPGEGIVWFRHSVLPAFWMRSEPPRSERRRHQRKYSAGVIPWEKSFFFRGPEGKLSLCAQNLMMFNQMAAGVDDDTWLYHLQRHDYSQWMRAIIKDEELALETERVEKVPATAAKSRTSIRELIEVRYTGVG